MVRATRSITEYWKNNYSANYTKTGSPTVTSDFIASNFSSSNYLLCTASNTISTVTSEEIQIKLTIGSSISSDGYRLVQPTDYKDYVTGDSMKSLHISVYQGKVQIWRNNSSGSMIMLCNALSNAQLNTTYWCKWTYENREVKGYYSTDGETFTLNETIPISYTPYFNQLEHCIGCRKKDGFGAFNGSIDLKETYFKVNGQMWWRPTNVTPVQSTVDDYNFTTERKQYISKQIKGTKNTYWKNNYSANYTKTGSPTVTSDFIASGFSSSNYLLSPFNPVSNIAKEEIYTKITTGPSISDTRVIQCVDSDESYDSRKCWMLAMGTGDIRLHRKTSDKGSVILDVMLVYNPQPNTTYWIYCVIENGVAKGYYSLDGEEYILNQTYDISYTEYITATQLCIGCRKYDGFGAFSGSIDLKETCIKVNNKVWWRPTNVTPVQSTASNYDFIKEVPKYNTHLKKTTGYYKSVDGELQEVLNPQEEYTYYKYTPFVQPVMTSNSQDGVEITHSGYSGWQAMNGKTYVSYQPSDYSNEDGWNAGNSTTGWWQVKFPYKIRISKLVHWTNSFYANTICNINGRFYTSSAKTTPLGAAFTCSSYSGNSTTITVSPAITTDTIYLEKIGGHTWAGMGELVITADKIVEGATDDYDFYEVTTNYDKKVTTYTTKDYSS